MTAFKVPTALMEPEEQFSDDNIINLAQNLRVNIVNNLLKDGKLPDDGDTIKDIKELLSDMATTAIQNKRIRVAEKEGASDREVATILAKAALQQRGNPFRINPEDIPARGVSKNLLDGVTLSEGQLKIGYVQETKDEFMDRVEGRT